MKLNQNAFALSCSIVCSAIYAVCAFFIWVFPQAALSFFNLFFHGIDLNGIYDPSVGLVRFILGLVVTFVSVYVVTALFVWMYNSLSEKK